MSLASDLQQLKRDPQADLATLSRVDTVLSQYSGRRQTIDRGRARRARLQQASALIVGVKHRPEAIQRIAAGLGMSVSSARRYFAELPNITG